MDFVGRAADELGARGEQERHDAEVMNQHRASAFTSRWVPKSDGLIRGAAGDLVVRKSHKSINFVVMTLESAQTGLIGDMPHLDGAVPRAAGEGEAVLENEQRAHPAGVALETVRQAGFIWSSEARRGTPQTNAEVSPSSTENVAVV